MANSIIWINTKFSLEKVIGELARDIFNGIVMISQAKMDGTIEFFKHLFSNIESGGVFKEEVIVIGRIIMDDISGNKNELRSRVQKLNHFPGFFETLVGYQDEPVDKEDQVVDRIGVEMQHQVVRQHDRQDQQEDHTGLGKEKCQTL